MAECICTSKQHGHPERCCQPTNGQSDFCSECEQKMASDRRTQAEPNLTPKVVQPDESKVENAGLGTRSWT